jgi:diguanylate cyclase (GGDEF)-like protein
MWTAGIALAAAAAAALAALAFELISARRSRRAETRLQLALGEVVSPLREIGARLAEAQARLERRRTLEQSLDEVVAAGGLRELMRWTAETAAGLAEASASVVQVPDGDAGAPLVATYGVGAARDLSGVVVWPPDGPRPVAFTLSYASEADVPIRLRSGAAVPLEAAGGQAFVAVFGVGGELPGDDAIEALRLLAGVVAPALARSRNEERAGAGLVDSLTGLGGRRVFHETLAREVAQAHRSDEPLSLLVLDVDDFRAVNDRLGLVAADSAMAEIGHRVRRAADERDGAGCRIGTDEFAVILPRATVVDAESAYAGVQASLAQTPPARDDGVGVSAGVTELDASDDAVEVFVRAHGALLRAKEEGKGTAVVVPAAARRTAP